MIGNKKRKEEKKEFIERKRQQKREEQQISQELRDAEERLREKRPLLRKEIVDLNRETDKSGELLYRLKRGLSKTKHFLSGSLSDFDQTATIDGDFMEELEERLLGADLGHATTEKILVTIQKRISDRSLGTQSEVVEAIRSMIIAILDRGSQSPPQALSGPSVYLFVGVNGVGKTTSIAKMAAQYKNQGKRVLVAAGDTFRAAAIEQLQEWCKRAEVDIVAKRIHSDPAATVFEAASRAIEEKYDILLCDTSGRLHTKKNLMDELYKIHTVMKKVIPEAPHASILVLDANTGQNAIAQTKEFRTLIRLDGLIVTKLDGTAKGGVIIGIVNEFEIPVYYVGIGEGLKDLHSFSPRLFADSLFEGNA